MEKFKKGDICYIKDDPIDVHLCTFICYHEQNAVFFSHEARKIFEWDSFIFDKAHSNYLDKWEGQYNG